MNRYAVSSPAAKRTSYPASTMGLKVIRPTAATVAADDPEMAPNTTQVPTVVSGRLARVAPNSDRVQSTSRREEPPKPGSLASITTASMPNLLPANNPVQAGFLGDYMWVATSGNTAYVVWADTRGLNGTVEEDLYLAVTN